MDDDQQIEENIQVVIRIKPIFREQLDNFRSITLDPQQKHTLIVDATNKRQFFTFDYVASQNSTQEQIFQIVGMPIIKSTLQGYNGCVIAYGQTGAGKTFSILGNPNDLNENLFAQSRGLLPRLLEGFFERIHIGNISEIKASYFEIYNQQIIDLLKKEMKSLPIREDLRKNVYVQGLTEELVLSYEDSLDIIKKGQKNRKIASTNMNSESSRSHTIFSLTIKTLNKTQDGFDYEKFAKLHIVDLAGRQKMTLVDGQRLKQGCNINKSLHVLGNVINSLVQAGNKKKFIPFRNSKLTFFLKDSLGGNAKTKLMANINPCQNYIFDTISTLKFAKRAKIVKLRAEVNENTGMNIQLLKQQIKRLKAQLVQFKISLNEKNNNQKIIFKQPLKTLKKEEIIIQKKVKFNEQQNKILSCFQNENCKELLSQMKQKLQLLVKNESHYKYLLTYYQHKLKKLNYFQQQKQKKFLEIRQINKNIPQFSRIYKQNIQLRLKEKESQYIKQLQKLKQEVKYLRKKNAVVLKQNSSFIRGKSHSPKMSLKQINQNFETLETHPFNLSIKTLQKNKSLQIQQLEKQLLDKQFLINQLQQQNSFLLNQIVRVRDIINKQIENMYYQVDQFEALQQQNEYLRLNIIELQQILKNYKQQILTIKQIQIKKGYLTTSTAFDHQHQKQFFENQIISEQKIISETLQKLKQIQNELMMQEQNSSKTFIKYINEQASPQLKQCKLKNKKQILKLNQLQKLSVKESNNKPINDRQQNIALQHKKINFQYFNNQQNYFQIQNQNNQKNKQKQPKYFSQYTQYQNFLHYQQVQIQYQTLNYKSTQSQYQNFLHYQQQQIQYQTLNYKSIQSQYQNFLHYQQRQIQYQTLNYKSTQSQYQNLVNYQQRQIQYQTLNYKSTQSQYQNFLHYQQRQIQYQTLNYKSTQSQYQNLVNYQQRQIQYQTLNYKSTQSQYQIFLHYQQRQIQYQTLNYKSTQSQYQNIISQIFQQNQYQCTKLIESTESQYQPIIQLKQKQSQYIPIYKLQSRQIQYQSLIQFKSKLIQCQFIIQYSSRQIQYQSLTLNQIIQCMIDQKQIVDQELNCDLQQIQFQKLIQNRQRLIQQKINIIDQLQKKLLVQINKNQQIKLQFKILNKKFDQTKKQLKHQKQIYLELKEEYNELQKQNNKMSLIFQQINMENLKNLKQDLNCQKFTVQTDFGENMPIEKLKEENKQLQHYVFSLQAQLQKKKKKIESLKKKKYQQKLPLKSK